jgi:hypothetical protein
LLFLSSLSYPGSFDFGLLLKDQRLGCAESLTLFLKISMKSLNLRLVAETGSLELAGVLTTLGVKLSLV